MQIRTIGSQQGDSQKTLTLRQYVAENGKVSEISYVTRIFRPNKTNSFALITDANYRVNVYETSPLYQELFIGINEWIENEEALFVKVDNGEKGHWTLGINEELRSVWVENPYGWHVNDGELALRKRREGTARKKGR